MAFAMGIFIGMSPLLGIHTVLGILFASLFRLNRLISLVGVYVTNPWTIIPIYSFSTWVGAKLLGVHDIIPHIDWHHLTFSMLFNEFRHLVGPFFLGTMVVATVSAVVSYPVIYRIAIRNRD